MLESKTHLLLREKVRKALFVNKHPQNTVFSVLLKPETKIMEKEHIFHLKQLEDNGTEC